MVHRRLRDISVWQFESFQKFGNILHFVSDRHDGTSTGKCSGLNLSLKVDDTPEHVLRNRKLLADNLNLDPGAFLFPDQCHTSNIRRVDAGISDSALLNTDALMTNISGRVLCVTTADCIPLIILDRLAHTIAVIHAGWRGLADGIIPGTIGRLKSEYNCQPENLFVGMGPSISAKHYEVGSDVLEKIEQVTGNLNQITFSSPSKGKAFLDLGNIAKFQLLSEGISETNIEISGICTFDNTSDFYSARKEGFNTGRFCTGIMIKE